MKGMDDEAKEGQAGEPGRRGMMVFGTPEFCECLRRCRRHGLTMSQVQVLSLLSCGVMARQEMADVTGTTFNNMKKTVQLLVHTGDVSVVAEGRSRMYGLTDQGRELVNRIKLR